MINDYYKFNNNKEWSWKYNLKNNNLNQFTNFGSYIEKNKLELLSIKLL